MADSRGLRVRLAGRVIVLDPAGEDYPEAIWPAGLADVIRGALG